MMNLILWLSIIWLPFLMYFLFKREAKLDKPIVLEVTLSAEARHGDKAKEIIRRFNLTQFITMLVFLLVAIPCFLIKDIGTALSLYCTWITLCIVLPFIPYIKTRNKLLKLQREYGYFCKEDTFWKLGVFYFNPEDKHFFINSRTGFNTTVNTATLGGKAVIVLSVITLLCMPFTGLLIKNTERTPVELKTEQNELIAKHGHTEYVIDINEIESVSLLYELPEGLKRRVGTATPTLLKGSFTSGETGNITLCIDQTVPPYILIETSTTRYLLNTGDTETTKLIFEQTEKQAE